MPSLKRIEVTGLLIFLSSINPFTSLAGPGGTGGGDPIAQEFVKSGWSAYYKLSKNQIPGISINLNGFKKALETVNVESTKDELKFENAPKCALYDGNRNKILINQNCILNISEVKRRELALHEYFRAMGVKDNNYQVSSRIAATMDADPAQSLYDSGLTVITQARVLLNGLKNSKRPWECYQLSQLNRSIGELVIKQSLNSIAASALKPSLPMAIERLANWKETLYEFCIGTENIHGIMNVYKDSKKNLEIYLNLVSRDSETVMADLASVIGEPSEKNSAQIREEYAQKFEKIGNLEE